MMWEGGGPWVHAAGWGPGEWLVIAGVAISLLAVLLLGAYLLRAAVRPARPRRGADGEHPRLP
jgi:hypothetical protein